MEAYKAMDPEAWIRPLAERPEQSVLLSMVGQETAGWVL